MPLSSEVNFDPTFFDDVVYGLSQAPKQLPCKYFYDERGSQLFDQICELDEYYLTRTELAIIEKFIDEMAFQIGSRAMLVEPGSGSSVKTRILLEHLLEPVAYVPIDISQEHLLQTTKSLSQAFPEIEILPVVADFTKQFALPQTKHGYSHAAMFFPGSTIGNFTPDESVDLMVQLATILGRDGGLLVGADLEKETHVLEAAYNDSQGITAEFNLNILHRINRQLNSNIDVSNFRHQAIYNRSLGRIETYLVSQKPQRIKLGPHRFEIAEKERILTEYSHKYTIPGFQDLASRAGFSHRKTWTDNQQHFAIFHLVNDGIDF